MAITGPSVSQLVTTVLEFYFCQHYIIAIASINVLCLFLDSFYRRHEALLSSSHFAVFYDINSHYVYRQINDDDVFCEGDTRNITEHLYDNKALDNATLKLQHRCVGRPLAHSKDKRCVFGTRGQQSILVMKKSFLAKGYCIRARCGR